MDDAAKLEEAVARLMQGIFEQQTGHWERFTTETGIATADDIPDFVNAGQRDMLRHMFELRPAREPQAAPPDRQPTWSTPKTWSLCISYFH